MTAIGTQIYDIGIMDHSRVGDSWYWRFHKHSNSNLKDYIVRFNVRNGAADLWAPGWTANETQRDYPVDGLLISHLLVLQQMGITIHSSAVSYGGRGLLFFGFSGAGKTTMAKLWQKVPGVRVLCDDRIIVSQDRDGLFYIHGTPWHSRLPTVNNLRVPLEATFLLRHDSVNTAEPMSVGSATAQLAARSALPYWDIENSAFIIEFVGKLATSLPCYDLGFVPDRTAVDYLQKLLSR